MEDGDRYSWAIDLHVAYILAILCLILIVGSLIVPIVVGVFIIVILPQFLIITKVFDRSMQANRTSYIITNELLAATAVLLYIAIMYLIRL